MNSKKLICLFFACSIPFFPLLTVTILAVTYYVAPGPGADDSNDGSLQNPWATFEYALGHLLPGDTLRLREGNYYESSISINLKGTADSPITIESYPGERAAIDGGIPYFKDTSNMNWELADTGISLYRSKQVFSGDYVNAWLVSENLHLIEYEAEANIKAEYYGPVQDLTPIYQGPGIMLDSDGHLYIRLTQNPNDLIDYKGNPIEPVPADTDPNHHEIAVFFSGVLLYFYGAEHLIFRDIDLQYSKYVMDIRNGTNNIEFDNCRFDFGRYAMVVRDASEFKIHHCDFNNGLPQYVYWTDVKNRPEEVHEPYSEFQSAGIEGSLPGFEIFKCTFRDAFDALSVVHGTTDARITDNIFIRLRDDAMEIDADVSNVEFAYNFLWNIGSGVSTMESPDAIGDLYIHHNIIDNSIHQHGGRVGNYRESDWPVWQVLDPFGSHGDMLGWWKVYNNTIVTRRSGYDWLSSGPYAVIGNPEKYVLNNIFLILDDRIVFRGDNASAGSHYDGNVFHRNSPGRYPLFYNFGNGQNYNSLSEFRLNSGTDWEINGLETDPGLDPFEYDEEPADSADIRQRYTPANFQVSTPGASYSGFDWPGTEHVDYRGAIRSAMVSEPGPSTHTRHPVHLTVLHNPGENPSFLIELENLSAFTLRVYDMTGRITWEHHPGVTFHTFRIDATDISLPAGIYLVSLQQEEKIFTRKFLILR